MNNLTIPLKFDLGQFLQFFTQLSPENKAIIFNALAAAMQSAPPNLQSAAPLKGSVLHYDLPLEPVAEDDWNVLA